MTSNAQAHHITGLVCRRCRLSHPTNSQIGQPFNGAAVAGQFVAQLAQILRVAQWRILPESFPDVWFRLVTVMRCMTGRIDMFDSYDLIAKIETFSQVSGKDRSIPRKTP